MRPLTPPAIPLSPLMLIMGHEVPKTYPPTSSAFCGVSCCCLVLCLLHLFVILHFMNVKARVNESLSTTMRSPSGYLTLSGFAQSLRKVSAARILPRHSQHPPYPYPTTTLLRYLLFLPVTSSDSALSCVGPLDSELAFQFLIFPPQLVLPLSGRSNLPPAHRSRPAVELLGFLFVSNPWTRGKRPSRHTSLDSISPPKVQGPPVDPRSFVFSSPPPEKELAPPPSRTPFD